MSGDAMQALYRTMIERWNARDADGFAACFAPDGTSIGLDGSTVTGRDAIAAHLGAVFADHRTARHVAAVRSVRALADGVALLRAVVGMVPPGADDLDPDVNAVQSIVATRSGHSWQIVHLQNTPAAFCGRPEETVALTDQLRAAAGRLPPADITG